jgi:outer membrane protein OmpA-like peptidoglycan-associated protein
MLLEEIAKEIGRRKDCVEIVGHTHQLGPKLLNQRLSIRRAEYIKHRLEAELPELSTRMIATGRGAEENLIGSKTGDMQDALDHRIEFDVIQCSASD